MGRLQTQSAMLGGDQQVFHDMGEPHGRFDPHDPRRPLDRMGGPHQRLDLGRIAGILFQFHEALGQHPSMGAGLFAKQFEQEAAARISRSAAHWILPRRPSNSCGPFNLPTCLSFHR